MVAINAPYFVILNFKFFYFFLLVINDVMIV